MSRPLANAIRRLVRPLAVHGPRAMVPLAAVAVLGGCITGNEAEEALGHDEARELEEARQLHEIGAISDTEYELRKAQIEGEVESEIEAR